MLTKKIEIFCVLFLIFIIIYILNNKMKLNNDAKTDLNQINSIYKDITSDKFNMINKIHNYSSIKFKNSFDGHIFTSIGSKQHNYGFSITTDNLPYQACLKTATIVNSFDVVYINEQQSYLLGYLPQRDKILNLCLIKKNNSTITFVSYKK